MVGSGRGPGEVVDGVVADVIAVDEVVVASEVPASAGVEVAVLSASVVAASGSVATTGSDALGACEELVSSLPLVQETAIKPIIVRAADRRRMEGVFIDIMLVARFE